MRQRVCLGSWKNPIWLGGVFASGLLLFAATTTRAAGVLNIPTPTFSASSGANDNVKSECELPQKLSSFIKDNAKGSYDEVNVGDAPGGAGRTLKIEFTNVLGVGGGAWSGPKSVTIQGTLTEGDKVVGTFMGRRTSTGGAFGGFKGTCAIIGRCVKTLGSDVGNWLKSPSMDGKLGEM